MLKLSAWIQSFAPTSLKREEGQTMAEYGVILAVITAAIITALVLLSTNIGNVLNRVAGDRLAHLRGRRGPSPAGSPRRPFFSRKAFPESHEQSAFNRSRSRASRWPSSRSSSR